MDYHAAKAFIIDKLDQELAPHLVYHGLRHTLDVLQITQELCDLESVTPYETLLLKTAALFHDAGFVISNVNHEALGCGLVRQHLPRFGYSEAQIQRICGMIMATKIPQSPQNKLDEILCDADLDYLGRPDFYEIGAALFSELRHYKVLHTEEAWNRLQISFLEKHAFFTRTNKQRRSAQKEAYLQELHDIVAAYDAV